MNVHTAIIAALPGELAPLLNRLRGTSKLAVGRFQALRGTLAGREVIALCSGMGERNAREATANLLCQMQPTILYSIGFGGAVHPGLVVGDLILANKLYAIDGATAVSVHAATLQQVPTFMGPHRFSGSILSTSGIINKQTAAALLPAPAQFPVLDMETATIAAIAGQANIPLLALRAISDGADMSLAFSLEEFCDRDMALRLWRVLFTAARKPRIIPQLLRLAINSRIAGKALAAGVCDLRASH
jgi:adenosylhomocysteine nucleosidase